MSFGRGDTRAKSLGGSNYNSGNPGNGGVGSGERVMQLEGDVKLLQIELKGKDAQIKRLEQWQFGDKYLATDYEIKDQIDQHRDETMKANMEDNKLMADAAYQTVQTL
jgi:hypothetical protein